MSRSEEKRNKKLLLQIITLTILIALTAGMLVLAVYIVDYNVANNDVPDTDRPPALEATHTPSPINSPAPEATPASEDELEYEHMWYDGVFELPLHGATGFAATSLSVMEEADSEAHTLLVLEAGQGFTILSEHDDWWNIMVADTEGWVMHNLCFINLPDVLPSIVYNITNARSSVARSSGVAIPNITGHVLYETWGFNLRLDRQEFTVPLLYSSALLLSQAQRAALADGNTIIVYEAFRPRSTQQDTADNLKALMETNAEVRDAINTPPWHIGWFISTNVSNHQRGAAVDVSLGRIVEQEIRVSGSFSYIHVTEHIEFEMPTEMHELSPRAVVFDPVESGVVTDWTNMPLAETVTEGVVLMQSYLTQAGFTPLASEWWHFKDLESVSFAKSVGLYGDFMIQNNYSTLP